MSEQQPTDLTSPEAVAAGQVSDVTAELDAAYGRGERG